MLHSLRFIERLSDDGQKVKVLQQLVDRDRSNMMGTCPVIEWEDVPLCKDEVLKAIITKMQ